MRTAFGTPTPAEFDTMMEEKAALQAKVEEQAALIDQLNAKVRFMLRGGRGVARNRVAIEVTPFAPSLRSDLEAAVPGNDRLSSWRSRSPRAMSRPLTRYPVVPTQPNPHAV